MRTYLLSFVQTLINSYLELDPYATTLRAPLINKTVAIYANGLPFPLFFHFTHERIILEKTAAAPQATIHGSLINLARLTRRDHKTAAMAELQIRIEGDIDTAHQFQHFWSSVHIDWEEVIASIAGDPFAVLLGQGNRLITRALQQARQTVTTNLGEYLQEELRFLPPREEIADFMNDVDTLRTDMDRLLARIQRLETQHE